jgi:uncharacterized protein
VTPFLVVALALALTGVAAVEPAIANTPAARLTFAVHPSVNQVAVTGARRGTRAVLRDSQGTRVAAASIDAKGSVLFRNVAAATGYVVAIDGTSSEPVDVVDASATPPASFYASQPLRAGYGYLETRDGTLLSINVTLPGPIDDGPYPTVVEYSGYDPSNPKSHQPASSIAQLLGFATVGINMRGTGCSGGAFDYFEPLQSLDGYDAIETVAAQPWVAHGEVGMVGISYPGITQLFVAQTRPPHLAAIAPLSVIDDTYATLYPGGILNDGFAVSWAKDRQRSAAPAGQRWAARRIAGGDETCAANQALRLQTPDIAAQIRASRFRDPRVLDPLAPATFVHDIDVPVFIAGSWQDEETGSHFADMLGDFAPGVPLKVTLMNGIHADSLSPEVLSRWVEFLDFYVARKIPVIPPATRALASALLAQVFGTGISLEPDRFTAEPSYEAALAAYEAEPPVRLRFDVGAGAAPGTPVAGFTAPEASWPVPGTTEVDYYLGARGELTTQPPAAGSAADQFDYDPAAYPATSATSEHATSVISALSPSYRWKPVPAGKALAYVSAPLAQDTVMAGTGSVDLWVRSTAPDVDFEVTLSEVRPDGRETYVQSGWLRASQRTLDAAASTPLLPVQTHTEADAAPLPKGEYTMLRIPFYPFAHAFRAGSRLRIVVQPPGGNRPAWAFDALRYDHPVTNLIARSGAFASKVALPVVPQISVPTPLPPCGALRGQPCRKYEPLTNRAASS